MAALAAALALAAASPAAAQDSGPSGLLGPTLDAPAAVVWISSEYRATTDGRLHSLHVLRNNGGEGAKALLRFTYVGLSETGRKDPVGGGWFLASSGGADLPVRAEVSASRPGATDLVVELSLPAGAERGVYVVSAPVRENRADALPALWRVSVGLPPPPARRGPDKASLAIEAVRVDYSTPSTAPPGLSFNLAKWIGAADLSGFATRSTTGWSTPPDSIRAMDYHDLLAWSWSGPERPAELSWFRKTVAIAKPSGVVDAAGLIRTLLAETDATGAELLAAELYLSLFRLGTPGSTRAGEARARAYELCRLGVNLRYALAGYVFTKPDTAAYFTGLPWYEPRADWKPDFAFFQALAPWLSLREKFE